MEQTCTTPTTKSRTHYTMRLTMATATRSNLWYSTVPVYCWVVNFQVHNPWAHGGKELEAPTLPHATWSLPNPVDVAAITFMRYLIRSKRVLGFIYTRETVISDLRQSCCKIVAGRISATCDVARRYFPGGSASQVAGKAKKTVSTNPTYNADHPKNTSSKLKYESIVLGMSEAICRHHVARGGEGF